jgi:hypothetical protein
MGIQAVPGFIGQAGYNHPVELMRNLGAAYAGRRSGAFRYNDFTLTPSGSAMQLTISGGDAMVMGACNSSTQGGYFAWSNGNETINWPAAAGSPRIDSLILRVIDTQYGTDASTPQAFWEVVSGTPSGSPTAVTDAQLNEGGAFHRHGGWYRVADFTVPAGATNLGAATVSNKRNYARLGRYTMGPAASVPPGQLGEGYTITDGSFQGDTMRYNLFNAAWEADTIENWQTWTPVVRNNGISGTPATISSTLDHARFKRVNDMVFYHFALTVNAAASNGASISLPVSSATVRTHCAGTLWAFNSTLVDQQSGIAYQGGSPGAPWDRLYCVRYTTTGLLDFPSGTVVRANGHYYVDGF